EQRRGNLPICLPTAGGEDQGLAECAQAGESNRTEEARMKAADAANESLGQRMHLHRIPPLLIPQRRTTLSLLVSSAPRPPSIGDVRLSVLYRNFCSPCTFAP